MSAERLRAAASKTRLLADAAICPCGGPACNTSNWFHRDELDARFDGSEYAVPFIATMSPTVALALAELLESVTETGVSEALMTSWLKRDRSGIAALAVADAILGGVQN